MIHYLFKFRFSQEAVFYLITLPTTHIILHVRHYDIQLLPLVIKDGNIRIGISQTQMSARATWEAFEKIQIPKLHSRPTKETSREWGT
jgi:hypothetical protein